MMKKHTTFLLAAFLPAMVFAQFQAIPNASFENWTSKNIGISTYEDPDGWNTVNAGVIFASGGEHSCVKVTGKSGKGMLLETKDAVVQIANAICTTADINITTQSISGGIPYAYRPDSLVGYYKTFPVGSDRSTIDFTLQNAAGDTIGRGFFEAPNADVATWTRFSIPIEYFNAQTPTNSVCLFNSSNKYNAVLGSQLYIDEINLIFNHNWPTSTTETKNLDPIYFYPNPVKDNLWIECPIENLHYNLYSVSGLKVKTGSLNHFINKIPAYDLSPGAYLLDLHEEDGLSIKREKIIVR